MSLRPSSIEILESRIAPANILVTMAGATGELKTKILSAGTQTAFQPAANSAAALAADASLCALVGPGDSLVFDTNNNGTYQTTDQTLVKVTAGRALVFFTDLNGDHLITPNEITGLRVSSGFNGAVSESVHGSIVTDLSATGAVATAGGKLSITKLSVTGVVDGSILGTGSLGGSGSNKLSILGGNDGTASVQQLLTGTATQGVSYSLNGGERADAASASAKVGKFSVLAADATLGNGLGSTNLSNVSLAFGAGRLEAGAGGSVFSVAIGKAVTDLTVQAGAAASTATPSAGGSVANIMVGAGLDDLNYHFTAAKGGQAAGKSGGAGGKVSGIDLFASMASNAGDLVFSSGDGGDSLESGAGGAGGSISEISVRSASTHSLFFDAGVGGHGDAAGGAGGQVSQVKIASALSLVVRGGAGGHGTSGGAGGHLIGFTVSHVEDDGTLDLATGDAGTGDAAPGLPGSISGLTVNSGLIDTITLAAGATAAAATEGNGAAGRDGGGIKNINLVAAKNADLSVDTLSVTAGDGGDGFEGAKGAGSGGNGGSISGLTLHATTGTTKITLTAGAGGNSGNESMASGGAGGSIGSVDVSFGSEVTLMAGNGGNGATAGGGGALGSLTFSSVADDGAILLAAGDSGTGLAQKDGGSIVTVTISGGDLASVVLQAGSAGAGADDSASAGGSGGDIKTLNITASTLKTLSVTAGSGASGGATITNDRGAITGGGKGGDGGSIARVKLLTQDADDPIYTEVSLIAGNAGDAGGTKAAGNGGSISGLNMDHVGDAQFTAGLGGSTMADGANGTAGNGGSIASIARLVTYGEVGFKAGDGGAGAEGGAGGDGGSIFNTLTTYTNFFAPSGSLTFIGGSAGAGSSHANDNGDTTRSGAGGNGGGIGGFRFETSALDSVVLTVLAGQGGDAGGGASGGRGGSVSTLAVDVGSEGLGLLKVLAGDGGVAADNETRFGQGGNVSSIAITAPANVDFSEATIGAGVDGDGESVGKVGGVRINGLIYMPMP